MNDDLELLNNDIIENKILMKILDYVPKEDPQTKMFTLFAFSLLHKILSDPKDKDIHINALRNVLEYK